jgi:hypothetical protein
MFYSDDQITAEEGFYRMSGQTIEEYWRKQEEWKKRVRKEEEEFERNLPKMIQNYLIKGSEIIEEQYLKNWQKCVECRVRDMYKGKDLDLSLKIIDLLNKNTPLNEIKKEFDEQNHTGWSRAICLSIIKDFCNKGKIFYNYIQ